ncbi:MAG TPA: rhomboid family intramembrane serine protease [Actinomycetota bacterium]|jgi:membrane associated rhomboid family serine protease|nr:rhomboid family intramembrane serine protease [Actinomycetota bacterium]
MSMLIPIRDLNPHKRFPVVTVSIIALNVFAALYTNSLLSLDTVKAFQYGAVPCDVVGRCPTSDPLFNALLESRPAFLSLFTSMFMHAGILHLGFNMLFLWVFGNNVEDRLGRIRFTLFYLAAGLAAAFAQLLPNADSTVPLVGASGAVSGVLGAYIVLWPRATIVSILPLGFFFTTIRTPAWVALGLWFALQLFSGLGQVGDRGVAYLAHIGGFVAGFVLIFVLGGFRRPPEPASDAWSG